MSTTDIEKKSLEAHVELCAERYAQLESKLSSFENRMDKLETHIIEVKDAIKTTANDNNKTIITIGTTIGGVMLTAIIGLLVHLILK